MLWLSEASVIPASTAHIMVRKEYDRTMTVERNPYAPPQAEVLVPLRQSLPSPRPIQVSIALILLWTDLGVSILSSILQWAHLTSPAPTPIFVAATIIAVGIIAWLNYKISVGRTWAPAAFLVLAVMGLVPFYQKFGALFARSALIGSLGVAQIIVEVIALYLLFTKPGRTWFERR